MKTQRIAFRCLFLGFVKSWPMSPQEKKVLIVSKISKSRFGVFIRLFGTSSQSGSVKSVIFKTTSNLKAHFVKLTDTFYNYELSFF